MASIHIDLPPDLKAFAERRAQECGHLTIAAYIEDLTRADAGTPDEMFKNLDQLEQTLLEALHSPAREMTDADWEEKFRRLRERRGAGE